MKYQTNLTRLLLLLVAGLSLSMSLQAQVHDNIAQYFISGTPTHGVKIKTNIPFQWSADMPTITLYGFSYGNNAPMNLQISFYIWHDDSHVYFFHPYVSSAGAYTPRLLLANENDKVVIYIDDRVYFQHFYVNAFSGRQQPTFYQGWTIADEPLTGSAVTEVPYKNAFKGLVTFTDGVWNSEGNVGIGTQSPNEKLSVNGKIRAHEIKVETSYWPDYVFQDDYDLKSLQEINQFIKANGHLPEIPKAVDAEENGISLGEMNKLLLKKIEELTLHLIEKETEINDLKTLVKRIDIIEAKLLNK